jgi:hypothetical protein
MVEKRNGIYRFGEKAREKEASRNTWTGLENVIRMEFGKV